MILFYRLLKPDNNVSHNMFNIDNDSSVSYLKKEYRILYEMNVLTIPKSKIMSAAILDMIKILEILCILPLIGQFSKIFTIIATADIIISIINNLV